MKSENHPGPRPLSMAEADELLPELEKSDLSVAEFARIHNVAVHSLYNARRRSRYAEIVQPGEGFVELRVKGGAGPRVTSRVPDLDPSPVNFLVELPNRYCVHVPESADSGHLQRILEVIAQC